MTRRKPFPWIVPLLAVLSVACSSKEVAVDAGDSDADTDTDTGTDTGTGTITGTDTDTDTDTDTGTGTDTSTSTDTDTDTDTDTGTDTSTSTDTDTDTDTGTGFDCEAGLGLSCTCDCDCEKLDEGLWCAGLSKEREIGVCVPVEGDRGYCGTMAGNRCVDGLVCLPLSDCCDLGGTCVTGEERAQICFCDGSGVFACE